MLFSPSSTQAQSCTSEPVIAGYRDFNYGTSTHDEITAEKPESKLWWNDGYWWGILWNPASSRYRIHRFDRSNQCWSNVGPDGDNRSKSIADALWDGQYLYVASHIISGTSGPAWLYRYSYNPSSQSYSLSAGFPVEVNDEKSETLTIAKDSFGQLWVTWQSESKIMVNRSLGDDLTWGTPFTLPVQGNNTDSDDISAVIAFGGNKIGIMWSNQRDKKMYFAVHLDNNSDTDWEPREEALADANLGAVADDHINLKVMPDNGGNVYAATKTSLSGSSAPLVYVLKRNANGAWNRYTFGTKSNDHTRPLLLIDEEHRDIYVFAMSFKTTPHRIYMKKSSLDNISLASGYGTEFIYSATDLYVNNPTSTKQNLNSATGLLVLASDKDTRNYLHNYLDLGDGTQSNVPPLANNDAATTPLDAPVTFAVLANDTDADGSLVPATVTVVSPPSNGTITSINSSTGEITYSPDSGYQGQDNFSYTVEDNNGAVSNAANVSVTVTGPGPTALTFYPVADAHVNSSSPSKNYGTAINVRLRDGSPKYNGYLKFSVSGITGAVQSAKVRLYADDGGNDGGSIYSVSNNYQGNSTPWTETGLNWNNAPAMSGTPLSQAGTVSTGAWVELNVTSAVSGNGTFSFALSNISTNSVYYSSKEGAHPPELVVEMSTSGGGNQPPVANADATTTVQTTPVEIDVLANDFDPDGSLDPATVAVVYAPQHGTINSINAATGAITYQAEIGFEGTDTFEYAVNDNSGASSNSASVTVTVSGSGPAMLTFQPIADANVKSSSPTRNYGSDITLRLRSGDPTYKTYIKFDVNGIAGSVQSAKLRLYCSDASNDGGAVYAVSNTAWSESGITWNNAPAMSGTPLSQVGSVAAGVWVEWDVTAAVQGDGAYSFGLTSNSTNSVFYSSKEGGNPPELLIEAVTSAVSSLGIVSKNGAHDSALRDSEGVASVTEPLPADYALEEVYPNPFNPSTNIRFALPEPQTVELRIFNMLGQKVRTLSDGIAHNAGRHHYLWDGRNDSGQFVPSGIYYLRLNAGPLHRTTKLVLMK